MRNLIAILLLAISLPSSAVDLRLRGEVTGFGGGTRLGEVLVRVYRDGVKEQTFQTNASGQYTIDIKRGGYYVIRFSLPGHVTKCFAVDTRGVVWEGDRREVRVAIEMRLFERVPDLDLSFFDLPMGLGRFCPTTGFLKWDQAYEARIRPEVERLMAEVRLRQQPVRSNMPAVRPPVAQR